MPEVTATLRIPQVVAELSDYGVVVSLGPMEVKAEVEE